DGIRDRNVTGVQTCALPISISGGASIETAQSETWTAKKYTGDTNTKITKFKRAIRSGATKTARLILEDASFKRKLTESDYGRLEIGRASCRERGEVRGRAGA